MLGLANMPPFSAHTVKTLPFLLHQHMLGFAAVTPSPLSQRLMTSKVSFPITVYIRCGFMGAGDLPHVT